MNLEDLYGKPGTGTLRTERLKKKLDDLDMTLDNKILFIENAQKLKDGIDLKEWLADFKAECEEHLGRTKPEDYKFFSRGIMSILEKVVELSYQNNPVVQSTEKFNQQNPVVESPQKFNGINSVFQSAHNFRTVYDLFQHQVNSKYSADLESDGRFCYSKLLKRFYESRDGLIGQTAKILSGNYYENEKRYWKWNERVEKIKELYRGREIDEGQKKELTKLVNFLQTNNYLKKNHSAELGKLYNIFHIQPVERRYGIFDKLGLLNDSENNEDIYARSINILKENKKWEARLNSLRDFYSSINYDSTSQEQRERISDFAKIVKNYCGHIR